MRDKVEKWRLQWTISCLISQLWYTAHKLIEEQKESSMVSFLIRQLFIRDSWNEWFGLWIVKCKRPNGKQTKNCMLLNVDYEQICLRAIRQISGWEIVIWLLLLFHGKMIYFAAFANKWFTLNDLFKLGCWPPTNIACPKWL